MPKPRLPRTATRLGSTRKTWTAGCVAVLLAVVTVGCTAVAGEQDGRSDPALAASSSPTAPSHSASATAEFTAEDPGDPAAAKRPSQKPAVVISNTTLTDMTAIALLATIPVKGKSAKTGYDRTGDFGTAWLDVDRNGCDTRNDILARDLTSITKSGVCKVLSGKLAEPYTGKAISFLRGQTTSALVQIDHMVALSNAWQTGAQKLTQGQRISLANDPMNLLAVDGSANAQKGDGDAATWLPAVKTFRCTYIAHQVSVKATYGLWVTAAEHDAMLRVLSTCPSQRAVTSAFAPAPAPVVAPKPAPVVVPVPVAPAPAVYYQNCDAVRAAGKDPILRGQPGYSSKLDRDGDGIGCE